MYPELPGSGAKDQHASTRVGGWGRTTTLLLNKTWENQNQDEKFILFPPRRDRKKVETYSVISVNKL